MTKSCWPCVWYRMCGISYYFLTLVRHNRWDIWGWPPTYFLCNFYWILMLVSVTCSSHILKFIKMHVLGDAKKVFSMSSFRLTKKFGLILRVLFFASITSKGRLYKGWMTLSNGWWNFIASQEYFEELENFIYVFKTISILKQVSFQNYFNIKAGFKLFARSPITYGNLAGLGITTEWFGKNTMRPWWEIPDPCMRWYQHK